MPTNQTAVEERISSTPGIKQFEPKFMKIGVLTAALQELTPREIRDADPDRAVEEWLEYARDLGADYIELSAALHPTEADVPQEAMLDPVVNTLDLRKPFNSSRANRVLAAMKKYNIGLSDVAYFDNMLHEDPKIRRKKHDFMIRVMDSAVMLGVDAVCGFVGRNQSLDMDQNLDDFRENFVPLLKAAGDRGLVYRVEQIGTTISVTRRVCGQPCIRSQSRREWGTISESITIPPTPSSWVRIPGRFSSTFATAAIPSSLADST